MIDIIYNKLQKSKFRSSFKLKQKDKNYIKNKGLDFIENHCEDFLISRISKIKTSKLKDGKQTPYKGHPVFIAQHATAICCRKCLKKWHNIDENRELTLDEIIYLKKIILYWIKKQMEII